MGIELYLVAAKTSLRQLGTSFPGLTRTTLP